MSMKSRTLGKLLVYGVRIGASACFGVCACSGSDHDVASSASDQHTASASTGAGESGNAASTTSGGAGGGAPATAGSQSSAGGAPATTDGSATGTDGGATTGPDYPDIEFVYDPEKDVDPVVCAEETLSAEPLPLDMYIILDRTGSMIEEMPAGEDCQLGAENPPTFNTQVVQGHSSAVAVLHACRYTRLPCRAPVHDPAGEHEHRM